MIVNKIVDGFLSRPAVFEWQQRLCNNYAAIGDHFARYFDVTGKDILDIGCSTGTCAGTIVPLERNRYVGIDISAAYVERARKRYPEGRFRAMDARKLSFEDKSFDVIMFIASLHHMSDDLITDCFREIRRVIRNDGVVLCAEPVFTRGRLLSTLFLTFDRGKYIRTQRGYQNLFSGFVVSETSCFDFSIHRFCSFVLRPRILAQAA